MDTEKVYETLDSIAEKTQLETNDINMLLKLSKTDNSEIKSYIAELLVMSCGEESEKVLINMCNDADEIVRINACDSLSAFPTLDTYNQLIKCLYHDKSAVVKTYAILSLADIINQLEIDTTKLEELFVRFSKDKDISISAACFKGLYILGKENCLKKLFDLFPTKNYQDRCMIVNILGDILNDENNNYIMSELEKNRKTETSKAVNLIIDNIIGGHKNN